MYEFLDFTVVFSSMALESVKMGSLKTSFYPLLISLVPLTTSKFVIVRTFSFGSHLLLFSLKVVREEHKVQTPLVVHALQLKSHFRQLAKV